MENKPGNQRIEIDVSGSKFLVSSDILLEKPYTKLGRLASRSQSNKLQKENDGNSLVFDRPVPSFQSILEYYQTGQLHMPANTCPKSFQKELEFWEIDPGELEKCCLYQYITFMDDFDTLYNFQTSLQKQQQKTDTRLKSHSGSYKYLSARMWAILDNGEASLWAKAYLVVAVVFVLLSILSLALSTLPELHQTLNACEMLEYMQNFQDYDSDTFNFLEELDCSDDPHEALMSLSRRHNISGRSNDTYGSDPYDWERVSIPTRITKKNDKFTTFEYTVIVFFTVELLLRLIFCPSFKQYFMSVLNIIEIIVLIASYISIILNQTSSKVKYTEKGVQILQFFQIFRIFRLLRVMKNVAAMRVLVYSVRAGYKDLFLVFLYLFSGIVMFGNFLYFVESTDNVASIPDAWWWGVITMTTVGYGDVVPKSLGGKLIACLCAISGVLLLSLMIPIFVNTFMSLYKFAHLHENHQDLKNQRVGKDKVDVIDKSMAAKEKLYSVSPM